MARANEEFSGRLGKNKWTRKFCDERYGVSKAREHVGGVKLVVDLGNIKELTFRKKKNIR